MRAATAAVDPRVWDRVAAASAAVVEASAVAEVGSAAVAVVEDFVAEAAAGLEAVVVGAGKDA
jgi:hypothetical protein